MKKNTYLFISCLSVISLMFASCSSVRQNTAFSERKYYNFRHHEPIVVFHSHKNSYLKAAEPKIATQNASVISEGNTYIASNSASLKNMIANTTAKSKATKLNKAGNYISPFIFTNANSPNDNESVYEYRPVIQQEQATTGSKGNSTIDPVVLVILAILISPLAVYLYDNAATTRFWIDLICWLLGIGFGFGFFIFVGLLWLVAVIYAVLIVTGSV